MAIPSHCGREKGVPEGGLFLRTRVTLVRNRVDHGKVAMDESLISPNSGGGIAFGKATAASLTA